MINSLKKFLNIAFKNGTRFKRIAAYLSYYVIQNAYSLVRPFVNTTGKGIGDKCWLKYGIENGKNSVMKHAVSNSSFMNVSLFWILDIKR